MNTASHTILWRGDQAPRLIQIEEWRQATAASPSFRITDKLKQPDHSLKRPPKPLVVVADRPVATLRDDAKRHQTKREKSITL